MPLSRSPVRTRSGLNTAPTEAAEGGPLSEDDRGRAARPDDAVVTNGVSGEGAVGIPTHYRRNAGTHAARIAATRRRVTEGISAPSS